MVEQDSNKNLEHLAYLFADRGDFARADEYLEAIRDDARRADTGRILSHFAGYYDYSQELYASGSVKE